MPTPAPACVPVAGTKTSTPTCAVPLPGSTFAVAFVCRIDDVSGSGEGVGDGAGVGAGSVGTVMIPWPLSPPPPMPPRTGVVPAVPAILPAGPTGDVAAAADEVRGMR